MPNIQYEFFTGFEARKIDPEKLPWPIDSFVSYAIEQNEIIARLGAMPIMHLEGLWIREDRRNSLILPRLVAKVENKLISEGRSIAMAFAVDGRPEMADYLERLNYLEMPLKVYSKALDKEN